MCCDLHLLLDTLVSIESQPHARLRRAAAAGRSPRR
eukprot:COSAG01_NODE_57353_length_312_cov_21.812207_2_plen_35_part_01